MKQFIRLLSFSLGLFSLTTTFAIPTTSHYTADILFGFDLAAGSQAAQDVTLSPAVTNSYGTVTGKTGLSLFGVGFGYQYTKPFRVRWLNGLDLVVGVDLLRDMNTFSGIETPYMNNGGGDVLNYSYNATSLALLGRAALVYDIRSWHPYGFLGIGPAYNQLFSYSESPADPAGSAVALSPYQANNILGLAYELGLGVQKDFYQHLGVAADVRYISFGQAALTAPNGEYYDSSAKLNANHLVFLGLTLSGIYRF